jgi:Rrf2 family protein
MIKLNRTTEYGLMALRHMSQRSQVTSAREVAESYGLPFEITAKTLQRLKDTGLIQSAQGARGGYTLKRSLHEISLAEFLQLMEGPQSVVACSSGGELTVLEEAKCCEYQTKCGIRSVMSDLNARVMGFLSGIRLDEIVTAQQAPSTQFLGK